MNNRDIILALGGGGARGLAHIGIIRVLEEAGYRVCGVAGTSIGSVVGGLYCAGALDKYEIFVRKLDLKRMLRFVDFRMPVRGLMGGRKIEAYLRRLVDHRNVEDLALPFTAVATELRNGEEVRLRQGDLALCIRASYAIPGFFTPVLIDGRWLIDGGVSTPVPVTAAKELGPHPVVAVNVNSSAMPPVEAAFAAMSTEPAAVQDEPRLLSSLSDSIAHLQYRLATYQLAVHPPAITLEPQLKGIGLFDFHRGPELIEEGVRCAHEALQSGTFEIALNEATEKSKAPQDNRPGGWLGGLGRTTNRSIG
ncbi:MAG: patatin-like phospholipase family protein [Planctomycetes bacterium]|nr:patatin-like phospholipase family protein [Planctomycetota bacterium]